MTFVCIVTLAIVALGVVIVCTLEYRRIKRKHKQMREEFKIDTSEWE